MASLLPKLGHPARRQRIVTILIIAFLAVVAGRLVLIQGVRSAELSAEALSQRLTTATIDVPRADIVDRNGVILATSVERFNIAVNQRKIADWKRVDAGVVVAKGPLDAAKILAPILGIKESELAADLVGDRSFVYIAKDVTPETWALVRAERIFGIEPESTSERIYPNGDIAGNVLGFMGGRSDETGSYGLAGVELGFEDELTGTSGSITYERGGGGTIIPTGVREETPAVPGETVVLTIDRDIQWYAQQQVAEELKRSGASRATVVVSDAQNGEILALVDSHAVDPNDPSATAVTDRGSRAVSSVFEPGSTAKVITMAAALEEGVVTPLSHIKAPYAYTTSNNQTFHDSHQHQVLKLTTAGVLAESSNTGTVRIGEQMSSETRYKYLAAFGLGQPTGVGLPGESGGILAPYEQWDGRQKYAVLFGQALSVTALQTNQVYSIIANGGVLKEPTVVKGFRAPDGTFTPRALAEDRRVISEKTSAQVMTMLESVTRDGTGVLAQIDGYRVAGKTGTAQASGPTGRLTSIVASFAGIAPADDPRIVVSVIVFDPKSSIWGGEIAAPLFKRVSTFALQQLRIPPSNSTPKLFPLTWD